MTESNAGSGRVADVVRGYQDRTEGADPSRTEIARIVGGAQTGLGRRRVRRRNTRVAAAALPLLVLAVFAWPLKDRLGAQSPGAQATATAATVHAQPGDQLTAGQLSRTVTFDGGRFVLAAKSSLGVQSVAPAGATVRLGQGTVTADITPSSDPLASREWHVLAGPFDVRVVGTLFSVLWEPEASRVKVSVERGEVEVTGPGISPPERVRGGGSFVAAVLPTGAAGGSDEARALADSAQNDEAPSAVGASSAKRSAGPDWRELAAGGDYRAALSAAEGEGLDELSRQLSLADLMRLADVARMGGNLDQASTLLRRIRERAPGSSQAALSAYSLATIALDQRRDVALGIQWCDTYLRENPGGSLAREALGRKLEAEHRLGRSEDAKRSAKRYLANYPGGGHRQFAEDVLSSPK